MQKELPSVLAVDTDADIDAVAGKGGVEGVIAVFDVSQVRICSAYNSYINSLLYAVLQMHSITPFLL